MKTVLRPIIVTLALSSMLGCSTGFLANPAQPAAGVSLHGSVHGGQQPITGATVTLYAAGTAGYAGPDLNLLTAPVTTDATGSFTISTLYSCTAGQQIYLVARGGDPGIGMVNPQIAGLAALGDCANLNASTFINLNEITTVASVVALAPFMSGYANIGTSPGNAAGLARAFNSVNKLANIATGASGGPSLATGAVAPVAEINTLADVLAACINSPGGTAGDNSVCGQLFAYATPSGGTGPTDTIGLALAIAQHPTLNVSQIYGYALPASPFIPKLSAAPTDWTVSIAYPTGFNSPRSTTIDAAGNIWVANSGNNTVTVLNQSGAPLRTLSGNGLNLPVAVAIDSSGNAFIPNKNASTVSAFTGAGATRTGSPYTVGTAPMALAFDTTGNLWVANSGSNNLSELNAAGSLLLTTSSGASAPTAIAINPK